MINTNQICDKELVNELTSKKTASYYGSTEDTKDNFALNGEITVTITLSEYRKLIKEVATKKYDIEKAETDKYERNCKISALEKENAELKQRLFAYVDTYGKIEEDDNND